MSKIEKLIEISASPEQVFAAFSDAENIRRWLPAVEQVRLIEGNRSLWMLATPDGASHDANAEVVERRAPEYIRWRVSRDVESVDVTGDLIETRAGGALLRLAIETAMPDLMLTPQSLLSLLLGGGNIFAAEKIFENKLKGFKKFIEGVEEVSTKERPMPGANSPNEITLLTSVIATNVPKAAEAAPPASGMATETNINNETSDPETAESEVTLVRPSPNLSTKLSAPAIAAAKMRTPPDSPQTGDTMYERRRPLPALRSLVLLALLVASALALLWLWQRDSNSDTDRAEQQTTDAAANNREQSTAINSSATNSSATTPASTSSLPESATVVAPTMATLPQNSITNDADTATSPSRARATEKGTLRKNLDAWIAATNDADLGAQMRFYAPALERYYLRTNFSSVSVREDKAKLMRRARLIGVNAEAVEVTFSPDNQTATMRFRKEYGLEGNATRDAVLQELRWRKTEEGWRIISERDLRVLR